MTDQNADSGACHLGHKRKAMECPACSGSTDIAWWKWYKGRTQSKDVKARIVEWLARQNVSSGSDA